MSSNELFELLYNEINLKNHFWWPNYGTFEVVVGAVLTQNTKWQNVESSLLNLKNKGVLSIEGILSLDDETLANLIKPSGFNNVKTKRLKNLLSAISLEFGDFENFKDSVDKEWLISQKGIGAESCSAILCYACERDEMVVDNYTIKIFNFLNYEFESYLEAQEWLCGVDFDMLSKKYDFKSLNELYCAYHGLFVEFGKEHIKGYKFSEHAKNLLTKLI